MSPRPDVSSLEDDDPARVYVRRIRPQDVTRDAETNELRLIPQKALAFDPDLSIHCVVTIAAKGSSVDAEYLFPTNGAVEVPTRELVGQGAHLKKTPHGDHDVLGPAHRSIFGSSLTPSKTDKANMRDVIVLHLRWIAAPAQLT